MPLFGGSRDISLFRTMNKELINDIIQTEIGYYKFVLQDSETNLYGESENKTYYEPLLIRNSPHFEITHRHHLQAQLTFAQRNFVVKGRSDPCQRTSSNQII